MFDSCAGLSLGGGCRNGQDGACPAEIDEKIRQAMQFGMSRADAEAKYRPRPLSPACAMGMQLANDCAGWNIFIANTWREPMNCPSDAELEVMVMCP